jgi:pimeloyl-ACP methyl ester carboxylesterase
MVDGSCQLRGLPPSLSRPVGMRTSSSFAPQHVSVSDVRGRPTVNQTRRRRAQWSEHLARRLSCATTERSLRPMAASKDFGELLQPTCFDVPVLILTGQWDPVTPPSYGDTIAKYLSRSFHIVVVRETKLKLFERNNRCH